MNNELEMKLEKITSNKPSPWLKRAEERIRNEKWLKHSMKIAVEIVCALDEENMTQKQLAEKLGVSPQQVNKYVKGTENLTLKTISEIETALDITIMFKKEQKAWISNNKVYSYFKQSLRPSDLNNINIKYDSSQKYKKIYPIDQLDNYNEQSTFNVNEEMTEYET